MKSTVVVLEDNFAAVRDAITGKILLGAAKAGGHVVEGAAKLNVSGRPGLEVRSDNLRGAINVTEESSTKTLAEVNIGPSNVIYARIHEYGGVIVPDTAPVLAWYDKDAGEWIHAKAVHIPARPYMRPALDDNEERIQAAVETEVWRGLDAAS